MAAMLYQHQCDKSNSIENTQDMSLKITNLILHQRFPWANELNKCLLQQDWKSVFLDQYPELMKTSGDGTPG